MDRGHSREAGNHTCPADKAQGSGDISPPETVKFHAGFFIWARLSPVPGRLQEKRRPDVTPPIEQRAFNAAALNHGQSPESHKIKVQTILHGKSRSPPSTLTPYLKRGGVALVTVKIGREMGEALPVYAAQESGRWSVERWQGCSFEGSNDWQEAGG